MEYNYKKKHIEQWGYIINKIYEIANLNSWNLFFKTVGSKFDPHILCLDISSYKKEYIDNLEKSNMEYPRYYANITGFVNAIEAEPLHRPLFNSFACEYANQNIKKIKGMEKYCTDFCINCPLIESNGGRLKHFCIFNNSEMNKLYMAMGNKDFLKAIDLATKIKDAWRSLKEEKEKNGNI